MWRLTYSAESTDESARTNESACKLSSLVCTRLNLKGNLCGQDIEHSRGGTSQMNFAHWFSELSVRKCNTEIFVLSFSFSSSYSFFIRNDGVQHTLSVQGSSEKM